MFRWFTLFALLVATPYSAAAINISTANIQQFQQLSPQQQKALKTKFNQGKNGGTANNNNRPATEQIKHGRAPTLQPSKNNLPSSIEQQFNNRMRPYPIDVFRINNQHLILNNNGFRNNNGAQNNNGFRNNNGAQNNNGFRNNNGAQNNNGFRNNNGAQNNNGFRNNNDFRNNGLAHKDKMLRSTWDRQMERRLRTVHQQLHQFGYNQFAGKPNSFTPAMAIPVPPEYILGPGDEIQLHYFGHNNATLSLILDRDGMVYLPKVGAIALGNISFHHAKALLAQTVRHKLTSTTVSITMGELRSIRIFVLGDALHPGSYIVSGLSTISNALMVAGGISKRGSLRHIMLKRGGKIIQNLDLYDFLLHGNSKHDRRLQPGDVIFIPPIGKVAAVAGEVVRPGIYELNGSKSTAAKLIQLAGGLISGGDRNHMQIDRLTPNGTRSLLDIDLPQSKKSSAIDGDIVLVFPIPGLYHNIITLAGQVARPGRYGLHKGMTLGTLIHQQSDLLPNAFLDYALIQRTNPKNQALSMLRVPLKPLLTSEHAQDVALQSKDKIYILSRAEIHPLNQVEALGELHHPGSYPLTKGMRVIDLLLAAGGTTNKAFMKQAEITRYHIENGEKRQTSYMEINLSQAFQGDERANIRLQADDVVMIRKITNWHRAEMVTLKGEFRFSGAYPIENGERLSSLIERAGGFTNTAYLPALIFTRESIRKAQQKESRRIAKQIEADITLQEAALTSLSNGGLIARKQKALEKAKATLKQMQSLQATGRMVITIKSLASLKGSDFDIKLKDGDRLIVPKRPDQVMVMGQTYNNTSLVYRKKFDRDDYINLAGGTTVMADENRIYIVKANGTVVASSSGWSRRGRNIDPGDTIVVPQKLDAFNILDSALDWSKVLMQIGVGIASLRTLGII